MTILVHNSPFSFKAVRLKISIFMFAAASVGLFLCVPIKQQVLEGQTMGTIYHVTLVNISRLQSRNLHKKIRVELKSINRIFSTYDTESEISRFNRLPAHEWVKVSPFLYDLARFGKKWHSLTSGAWDGTVWPLYQLWGFTQNKPAIQIPSTDAVQSAMKQVGYSFVNFGREGFMMKTRKGVSIDLSSIAKGYAVDRVGALLHGQDVSRFMVEIGGEVVVSGKNGANRFWRLGINIPDSNSGDQDTIHVIEMKGGAIATSGTYRRFYEVDGRKYAHVLDPRTGYPVQHDVVSVTITAPTCLEADAIATSVLVMGKEAGLSLIHQLDGIEGFLVIQDEVGEFEFIMSKGWVF
ncbi:MAG: FAD:protein FMN transferase [Candidatus Margulisbacteria bacterium]|nr:FAD:protein FMN transferase [Candidatus Margulisiibacteriota bacterium]